ncbi:MAG: methionine--tRNA ligase [Acidimicrobiales bacterium]
MTTTYLTVAIPYVNASPHLGYAYELVEADVYARSRRAGGDRVRFLGGTDDYSLKNVLAAEKAGVPTAAFVNANAERFAQLAGPLELSFDDYIKTSNDTRHAPAVERLWRACASKGDLYKRSFEGNYCVGCEAFYEPDELIDSCCPEHHTRVEPVAEENWFFCLSAYQDQIEMLISSDELLVSPKPFKDEALAFIRGGLADISVSRSANRARGWGLGVPEDPSQVVYVWFDALASYVSALEFGDEASPAYDKWWVRSDERIHVIGKGILRFHAVYWPAFLASAGQLLPTRIQVHPYLTVGGAKLAKSTGDVVNPSAIVEAYGTDALRWWFARDVGSIADTDFTPARLVARANEDLANGLGNLVNRIVSLIHRYRGGEVPSSEIETDAELRGLETKIAKAVANFDLRAGTRFVCDAVATLNREIEGARPWAVAKELGPEAVSRLDSLLARYVADARAIASAAAPFVPSLSSQLLEQLGSSSRLPTPRPAFVRIESP